MEKQQNKHTKKEHIRSWNRKFYVNYELITEILKILKMVHFSVGNHNDISIIQKHVCAVNWSITHMLLGLH